jgi:hypothetical protein
MMSGTYIRKTEKLTFILDNDLVIVKTSQYQSFILEATEYHWKRRLLFIRRMIQDDGIKDIEELAMWCGSAIRLVPTGRRYD